MITIIHRVTATIAFLCIAVFFSTTIIVELFGTQEIVTQLKNLIVWPGLFILVPSIAITGASGVSLAKSKNGRLTQQKKKRMPFIAANGLLVLIPCAVFLNHSASIGAFDTSFYIVQAIELIAGSINLILMGMNILDGLKMTGRLKHQ